MSTPARAPLLTRGRRFTWGARTYVMGVLNVTPDSFSGDGRPAPVDALARALELAALGVDVLDVGAESTRPGAQPIDATRESARLLPVVRAVRAALPEAVLSIDTYKPAVLAQAHGAGGDWLNSIWGLSDELLGVAAEHRLPVVIMHNSAEARYDDVVDDVVAYLETQALRAVAAGLPAHGIMLDPGIGFGKTADQNLAVLAALDRVVALGFPTLVGTSRKSTIGRLTGRNVGDRSFGTAATVALAIAAKVDIVRVHDVAAMRDVAHVADAIVRGWRPPDWDDDGRGIHRAHSALRPHG